MLKSTLMVWSRVSSVTAEGGNGVAEIRTSPQHGVHEGAQGVLVGFGGDFR